MIPEGRLSGALKWVRCKGWRSAGQGWGQGASSNDKGTGDYQIHNCLLHGPVLTCHKSVLLCADGINYL